MKTYLNRFYLLLLPIVISLFFVQCNGDKTNLILKQIAIETNKLCPILVDEITVLDSCEALPNKVFRYNYTVDTDSMPETNMAIFELSLRKQAIHNAQNATDVGTKNIMALKSNIKQRYFDNRGRIILEYTITPEEYNKKPDMQSDEYVYNEIREIVDASKSELPIIDDLEVLTKVESVYPRTLVYNFTRTSSVKPASFDSIEFKENERVIITENIKSNIFSSLLKDANISYKYKFTDKNNEYLCTLDISPEDYK